MVFEEQIDHKLNSNLSYVQPGAHPLSLNELKTSLEAANPGYKVSAIAMSTHDDLSWSISLSSRELKSNKALAINQYTGAVIGQLDNTNDLMNYVHQFHIRLMAGKFGETIVSWAAPFLLLLSISGLILWWPRKIFKINFKGSGKRLTFDLHNALGIYSSIFLMIFAVTGIVIHWDNELTSWINNLAHVPANQQPARPETPAADAVQLNPDQLVAIAERTEPGARAGFISLPDSPKNPVLVLMRFPEDLTPGGRTRVTLDAYTGKVLLATDSRTGPLGFRMVKVWNRAIHTGDIYGWPTKILASFFSLMLPVMAVTGPLIWWNRRRKKSTVPAAAAATGGA
jgi:uncharacterized iron-regulated membrane protein